MGVGKVLDRGCHEILKILNGNITVTFQPGIALGAWISEKGVVMHVEDGQQAKRLGVGNNMVILLIRDAPFSRQRLHENVNGLRPFAVTFSAKADDSGSEAWG